MFLSQKARKTAYEQKKKEWDDWEAQAEREEEAYRATRQLNRVQVASPRTRPDASRTRRVLKSDYTDRFNSDTNRSPGRRGQVGFPSRVSRRGDAPSSSLAGGEEERETPDSAQMDDTTRKFMQQRLAQKIMGFSRVVEDIQTSQRSRMAGDGIDQSTMQKNASNRRVGRTPPGGLSPPGVMGGADRNLDRWKNQNDSKKRDVAPPFPRDTWADATTCDMLDW